MQSKKQNVININPNGTLRHSERRHIRMRKGTFQRAKRHLSEADMPPFAQRVVVYGCLAGAENDAKDQERC